MNSFEILFKQLNKILIKDTSAILIEINKASKFTLNINKLDISYKKFSKELELIKFIKKMNLEYQIEIRIFEDVDSNELYNGIVFGIDRLILEN
ncbi:hypothetical protein HERIO_2020 [Hepatospora eriocheir]|uniref:Uncharacterized protein n=1 Tax=Hepatospora eriocheir TaxID=1081669 RepID=A0A1X0Q896_9MICR|nr:hypothetical protein HERIO_2020 [Hepatospora eriocheir]